MTTHNERKHLKKILFFSQLMKYFGKNSPQLKQAGIVVVIIAAVMFGLAIIAGVALLVLLFQVFSSTNISLDVNQLVGQLNAWVSGLFGAGQEALENAPVQIEVSPSQ
ncbi:hypothetical protein KBD87_04290 [Candidatus Saccharibacteria bacterium]|nr:hypothetical protein [Candidatus Saccharibacteria bacterium]